MTKVYFIALGGHKGGPYIFYNPCFGSSIANVGVALVATQGSTIENVWVAFVATQGSTIEKCRGRPCGRPGQYH